MNKQQFNAWLDERVQFQVKLTISAMVGMIAIGTVAFVVQGGLLFILLKWGYGLFPAFLALLGIFGGMGTYTWVTAPNRLCDEQHDAVLDDRTIEIPTAPNMSTAWTFAMGSLESDQSILERIFGMMMLVPRMYWTAWYISKRIKQVKAVDTRECGAILRYVLKKAERVDVCDIAEKRPETDLPITIRQLSLFDGVVFLTKGKLGLTLANRFKDDLEAAMGKSKSAGADINSPFDE